MKLLSCIVLSLILFTHSSHAQEARQMIEMYKTKLFDEKKLKPFSSVKMSLEVTTPEGKFPATLIVMENMIYKLEVQGKKGKDIEFIDLTGYKLFSPHNEKKKLVEVLNSEIHFRKKLFLNFYPFLHDKPEFPYQEMQPGMDMNGGGVITVMSTEPIAPAVQETEDPSIKKYVQLLPFNNMSHTIYLNMKDMNVFKIETKYDVNGVETKEVVYYSKFKLSPEGFSYPSEFTTVFGEATVKTIQFNPKLTSTDLNVDF